VDIPHRAVNHPRAKQTPGMTPTLQKDPYAPRQKPSGAKRAQSVSYRCAADATWNGLFGQGGQARGSDQVLIT
jgi:hypothetical protein